MNDWWRFAWKYLRIFYFNKNFRYFAALNSFLIGNKSVLSDKSTDNHYSKRKIIPLKNYEINDEFQAFTSDHKLTKRELRFLQFASVEFDDIVYMTPRDFLDSLILDKPKGS